MGTSDKTLKLKYKIGHRVRVWLDDRDCIWFGGMSRSSRSNETVCLKIVGYFADLSKDGKQRYMLDCPEHYGGHQTPLVEPIVLAQYPERWYWVYEEDVIEIMNGCSVCQS